MSEVFVISDTHFGHDNIYKFTGLDGLPVREHDSAKEGDEFMVQEWNAVVSPNDKVYHLGDVVMKKQHLPILDRLNGKKVLIRGNHDILPAKEYLKYFYDVRGHHKLGRFIMTHFPIHPESIPKWCNGNIHGHIHEKVVVNGDGTYDHRYINVSVENIDYRPVNMDLIVSNIGRVRYFFPTIMPKRQSVPERPF